MSSVLWLFQSSTRFEVIARARRCAAFAVAAVFQSSTRFEVIASDHRSETLPRRIVSILYEVRSYCKTFGGRQLAKQDTVSILYEVRSYCKGPAADVSTLWGRVSILYEVRSYCKHRHRAQSCRYRRRFNPLRGSKLLQAARHAHECQRHDVSILYEVRSYCKKGDKRAYAEWKPVSILYEVRSYCKELAPLRRTVGIPVSILYEVRSYCKLIPATLKHSPHTFQSSTRFEVIASCTGWCPRVTEHVSILYEVRSYCKGSVFDARETQVVFQSSTRFEVIASEMVAIESAPHESVSILYEVRSYCKLQSAGAELLLVGHVSILYEVRSYCKGVDTGRTYLATCVSILYEVRSYCKKLKELSEAGQYGFQSSTRFEVIASGNRVGAPGIDTLAITSKPRIFCLECRRFQSSTRFRSYCKATL